MPVTGDLSKPALGIEGFDEQIDHFFHLAAIYDMAADEEAMEKANIEGTRHVIEFANSIEVGRFHHTSSIAVAGQLQGRVPGGHVRRGPEASRTPTTAPSTSPSGSCARASRRRRCLPPGHRRRPLRDRRDGQDRRPLLLLQAAPAAAPRAAGVGAAGGPPGRRDQHRAGRLRRQGDGPHRPPARRRPAGRHLPPRQPRADEGRRDAQRVRQGRARAAVRDARRPEHDQRDPEAGARGRHGAADGQADPRTRSTATSASRRRPMENRDFRCNFDARDTQRALSGHGHRGAAAVDLRAAAVGLLGAQPRPGPVPRALAGQLDRRARRS